MGEVNKATKAPKVDTECILRVLQAYGPSTYELEDALFHKYLMICQARKEARVEQPTRDKFHYLLDDLSTLGYVRLISRGDRLYWMRLRSPLEIEEGEELTPERATKIVETERARKEAEEAEALRGVEKKEEGLRRPTIGEMADAIISGLVRNYDPDRLRSYMVKGEPDDVRKPIKELHEALISGVDEFRLYIERNMSARLKGQLTYFLASAGRDALLAALAISLMIPLHVAVSPKQLETPP